VAARTADPRGGEYLEVVGFYNPRTQPAELRIDLEKVDKWLAQGAELSDTAASLIRKVRKGGDKSVLLRDIKAESLKAVELSGPPKKRAARKKADTAESPARTE
jgi:small subunit ribosomal protein S16